MVPMMRSLISLSLLIIACNSDPLQVTNPVDLGSVYDFSVTDLSNPDLAVSPDLSESPDLSALPDLVSACVHCLDGTRNLCTSHCCGIWPACMPDFGL